MEIIIEILFNIVFEFVMELIIAFGYESLVSAFKERRSTNKYLGLVGCFMVGCILGLISFNIYSKKLFTSSVFPGISMLISPILVGLTMKKYGEMRIRANKTSTILATFNGGALFAFGYALIRFILFK